MTSLLIMFPWRPCLLLSLDVPVVSYAAVHPPVANVLTAVYAPGVPAVTSVSAFVASSSKVDIPTATAVTNVSGAPAGAGDHAIAVGPAFNVVPAVIASLLLLAN